MDPIQIHMVLPRVLQGPIVRRRVRLQGATASPYGTHNKPCTQSGWRPEDESREQASVAGLPRWRAQLPGDGIQNGVKLRQVLEHAMQEPSKSEVDDHSNQN